MENIRKFVEEFLPDYKEKHHRFITCQAMHSYSFKEIGLKFAERNFSEALQEYGNQIAKRQREICAENADTIRCDVGHNSYIGIDKDSILNAPSPLL